MPLPSQILNDIVMKTLDTDPDNVNKSALEYAKNRMKSINLEIGDLKISIHQEAGLINLIVSGTISGEVKKGKKTWTKMELLTTTTPFTHFIDNVLKDVFEVPLEGTPIS